VSTIDLSVTNVGGIHELDITLDEGTSLITGENASNKTSLLQALLFALGKDEVPLRTGVEQASVTLEFKGETVKRTATRKGRSISVNGEPLIDDNHDRKLYSRFAGLLETNPLRRAVQTDTDFDTLLKEPLNLDDLEQEQSKKLDRKRTVQSRLADLDDLDSDLASVESKLEQRHDEITELEETLEALYEDLPNQDDQLKELHQQRSEIVKERERLVTRIDDLESAIEQLSSTIEETERELDTIEKNSDLQSLRQQRANLQEKLDEIDERIGVLQTALTANRELLDADIRDVFEYSPGIEEDSFECWACGQQAEISSFESAVEQLTDLIEQEKERRREYEPQLAEIEEEIEEAKTTKRKKSRLRDRFQSTKSKREMQKETLEETREQLAEIEDDLSEIDDRLEETKDERSEIRSTVSKQIEQTRATLETKRQEVNRLESKRVRLQEKREERQQLKEELGELETEIQRLTTRIENLESDLRTAFNSAMDDLIAELSFEDIERMWLDGEFDLVVAREIDGTVQEDSVDHLAESERDMIGLVLGLAGFMAYDVDDIAPVLVLDSLGAFDENRTNKLLEYFTDQTEFLVAAVHPEKVEDSVDYQIRLALG